MDWGKTPVALDYIYSEIPPSRPVSLFVRLTTHNSEARDATQCEADRSGLFCLLHWIVSVEKFSSETLSNFYVQTLRIISYSLPTIRRKYLLKRMSFLTLTWLRTWIILLSVTVVSKDKTSRGFCIEQDKPTTRNFLECRVQTTAQKVSYMVWQAAPPFRRYLYFL